MIEMEKLQLKKGDYWLLLFVLVLLVVLLYCIAGKQQGDWVHVTANGTTTAYSLEKEQRILIYKDSDTSSESDSYITNILVIADGQAYMEKADCPDQICVKHKSVSNNGEMIICLPNEVFVEVKSSMENGIDN